MYVYEKATDPEVHTAVKNGVVYAYEGTKKVGATQQIGTEAIQKVQDPVFQQSVKEKTVAAATFTKEAAVKAYHKVQEPDFQESVKTNLKTGFEKTKQLVTGEAPKQPAPAPAHPAETQKKPHDQEDEEEEML